MFLIKETLFQCPPQTGGLFLCPGIMKPTKNHLPQLIAIYADDKKGLLAQILMLFNRRDYQIDSLNVARTDLQEVVLITLEVYLPDAVIDNMLRKIEKIIEVYHAEAYGPDEIENPKVGLYRMGIDVLDNTTWVLLQKHGATLCGMGGDTFLVRKIGTENDLRQLYNQLDGPQLLDFCQSSLVAPEILLRAGKMNRQRKRSAIERER
jgi:acetolactate synthase-1/3 small subunit